MSPFTRIAAYAPDGVTALSLGMVSAVFASRPGFPAFDLAVCTAQPGQVSTDLGVPLLVQHDLSVLAATDLVLVLPGSRFHADTIGPVPASLRLAHSQGATIAGHCVGVFLMAAAGLLDGLEATTHWEYAAELAAAFPQVTIRPEALYVDQGSVVTGAGVTAGIDMCLHLIRREFGAAAANQIARTLILPPHRDGGQSQFIPAPVAGDSNEPLADVLRWARANLAQRPSVGEMAARAMMSRRSFIRHFTAATGTTPHAWLRNQRLGLAEELLETTSLSIEQIAGQAGYASAATFREQFTARRGITPTSYRSAFHR